MPPNEDYYEDMQYLCCSAKRTENTPNDSYRE